jgi:hypothetical protein
MSEPSRASLTTDQLCEALRASVAATGGVGLYQSLAIIGALGEARIVDPMAVAKWADFFAVHLPANTSPDARAIMHEGLSGFASAIRSKATIPKGAGRA